MDLAGIEPASARCERTTLPLSYRPKKRLVPGAGAQSINHYALSNEWTDRDFHECRAQIFEHYKSFEPENCP